MGFHRGIDGSEPVRPHAAGQPSEVLKERRLARSTRMATGTLACPECDAPVAPAAGPMSPADPLACPFCAHAGAVRDFLSLTAPARPARVVVRVLSPARPAARR